MKRWLAWTGFALGCAAAPAALGQAAFPVKPVRMVVAFTAGSETDYLARIVGQKLGEAWGQQVVVENRPGAGGVLASSIVAAAPGFEFDTWYGLFAPGTTPRPLVTQIPAGRAGEVRHARRGAARIDAGGVRSLRARRDRVARPHRQGGGREGRIGRTSVR